MHEVRVFANHEDDGPRWLAEDDIGFCGGDDSIHRLRAAAAEWLDAEDVDAGNACLVYMSDGRIESLAGTDAATSIDSQPVSAT